MADMNRKQKLSVLIVIKSCSKALRRRKKNTQKTELKRKHLLDKELLALSSIFPFTTINKI